MLDEAEQKVVKLRKSGTGEPEALPFDGEVAGRSEREAFKYMRAYKQQS